MRELLRVVLSGWPRTQARPYLDLPSGREEIALAARQLRKFAVFHIETLSIAVGARLRARPASVTNVQSFEIESNKTRLLFTGHLTPYYIRTGVFGPLFL